MQASVSELMRVDPAQRLSALALLRQPWVCGVCAPMEIAADHEPATLCSKGPATLDLTARAGGPPAAPVPLADASAPGSVQGSGFEPGPPGRSPGGESGERLSRALHTLQLLRGGPDASADASLPGAPRHTFPGDDAGHCIREFAG